MKRTRGYISTVLSAVSYGTGPLIATLIYRHGFGVNSLAFLRVLFPLPVLGLLVLLKAGESFRISARQALQILILALTNSVLTSLLLFESIRYIDTGIATSLNFSYPALVILFDRSIYHQKADKRQWIALLLCLAGVAAFCNPGGTFTWKGFLLALGSGFSFAVYVLYMDRSRIMDTMGFYSFTFYHFLISALLLLPIALVSGEMTKGVPAVGWLLMLFFAFCDGLAGTMLQETGVHAIGGRAASIISTIEPVTSVLLGVVFLREAVTLRNTAGICLIVSATVYLILGDKAKQ